MNVAATQAAAQTAQNQSAGTGGPQVDYQTFMRLLVAQMKNQDPMSPMESTDFIAQLATFSQVEQSIQMNTKLDQILQASAMAQATDLIGREIIDQTGEVSGIVKEIKLFSDGVIAVLESGEFVPVLPGVTIR